MAPIQNLIMQVTKNQTPNGVSKNSSQYGGDLPLGILACPVSNHSKLKPLYIISVNIAYRLIIDAQFCS